MGGTVPTNCSEREDGNPQATLDRGQRAACIFILFRQIEVGHRYTQELGALVLPHGVIWGQFFHYFNHSFPGKEIQGA